MPVSLGLELCDTGFLAATSDASEVRPLAITDRNGATDWPGFASQQNSELLFGRAGEDDWFVHPRCVVHTFWSKLAHEPSTIGKGGKLLSFSELAYFFLREFAQRTVAAQGPLEKVVLAVPGAYLKNIAAEEEKIGLLLGMAADLKIPLAGIVDMACAALCDPRAPGFSPTLPIMVLDLQLEAAEFTQLAVHDRLERKAYFEMPNSGYARLLKHLTATMGNRFLRHTAFDTMEDGRIEQAFFRQTKDFLLNGADEHRYQINTARRNYEMVAKRDQLAADVKPFVDSLLQSFGAFVEQAGHAPGHCTVALTHRSAALPGIEARLRSLGYVRQLRLPTGAAAAGAARIGANRLNVPADVTDVPVEISVPLSDTRRTAAVAWEIRLRKAPRFAATRPPTHAILDGLGWLLAGHETFTIGASTAGPDLPLPETFSGHSGSFVSLHHHAGRLWFTDPSTENSDGAPIIVESGDSLTVTSGNHTAVVLFASCPAIA
jgi:hypothetical protein